MKTWRRLGRARGLSWGRTRFALTRMGLQAEAVAALQGGQREVSIINEEYEAHMQDCITQHKAFFKFGCIDRFFRWFLMEQFQAIFCYGRGIWFPTGDEGRTSIERMGEVRSEAMVQYMLFRCAFDLEHQPLVTRTLTAALVCPLGPATQWTLFSRTCGHARRAIEMVNSLRELIGPIERVTELLDLLETITENKRTEDSEVFVYDDAIGFDGVDIVTPSRGGQPGVTLVKGLSFRLEVGDSLLLVGHNGAGKSSIFRCLGALWSVPSGKITKPKNSADIFYIPQRPYNVVGTLADQMTYPDTSGAETITLEHLQPILREVDLEYLLDRCTATDQKTKKKHLTAKEFNWENILSLGEKQRLAIARLLHHEPRFAILDECTSGVVSTQRTQLCVRNVPPPSFDAASLLIVVTTRAARNCASITAAATAAAAAAATAAAATAAAVDFRRRKWSAGCTTSARRKRSLTSPSPTAPPSVSGTNAFLPSGTVCRAGP
eukprot:SAG11_NODE_163_length_13928_cov_29.869188_6_plen_492_part_00